MAEKCPYCNNEFKQLNRHLKFCKSRVQQNSEPENNIHTGVTTSKDIFKIRT